MPIYNKGTPPLRLFHRSLYYDKRYQIEIREYISFELLFESGKGPVMIVGVDLSLNYPRSFRFYLLLEGAVIATSVRFFPPFWGHLLTLVVLIYCVSFSIFQDDLYFLLTIKILTLVYIFIYIYIYRRFLVEIIAKKVRWRRNENRKRIRWFQINQKRNHRLTNEYSTLISAWITRNLRCD